MCGPWKSLKEERGGTGCGQGAGLLRAGQGDMGKWAGVVDVAGHGWCTWGMGGGRARESGPGQCVEA